jgi:CheY-like chemotaxis protein
MNGEVHVESVPGRGSRFSFSAGVATPTASQPAPDTRLSGMRILLADDNQTVRAELSAVLARAGAEVIDACGGAAAIAALRAEQAAGRTVDFALIDDRMPTMAGAETAAGIVAASNNPPRIAMMITTDDLATRIAHLRAAKIERWLVKPVKRAELVAIAAGARIGAVSAYRPPSIRRPPHPPGAPIDIDNGRALRILFADDSPDNRLLVTAFLRKLPFTVDTVEDGQLAIDRFKLARYDLVLMDIQMPVADGYTATRAIREWERARRVPRTPIIALSAAVLDESVRRAIEAGCDSHLAKPINKAALIAAIRAATAATDMKTEPVGASGANGVVDAGPIAD